MDLPQPVLATVAIAVALAAIAGGVKVLAAVLVAWRKFSRWLDEIAGEPASFGRAAKPGLVEKVDAIGATQDEHTEQISRILHELYPNSGLSLRDAVDRLERQSGAVQVNVNPATGS